MEGSLLSRVGGWAAPFEASALMWYASLNRGWAGRWGATPEETGRELPGDELIPRPRFETTRAVTIDAAPAAVWPWLAQIGYRRAGWYSYDWIHRLLGCAGSVDDPRRSARRVVPELQAPAVGDVIKTFAQGPWTVVGLEPGRLLLLDSLMVPKNDERSFWRTTWAWLLEEPRPGVTRLLVRSRYDYTPSPVFQAMRLVIEPGGFIMERKTLLNLRQRATGGAHG